MGRTERGRRAARLLSEFGLGDQADVRVDWYSGGMAQRLMIARSLRHEPAVLFLDEPTAGLDPHARLFAWNRIRDLREWGITVVLTTHDMDEAAELADRVGIVDNGRLLALDTPASLIHGHTLARPARDRQGTLGPAGPGRADAAVHAVHLRESARRPGLRQRWLRESAAARHHRGDPGPVRRGHHLPGRCALVLGRAPWHPAGLGLLVASILLGCWAAAGIGLTIGTLVPPAKIGIMFGLVLTPLMFTGATQYPWMQLDRLRWFQIVTAANPLTYCAEGVRGAMVPGVPHIAPWICVVVLLFAAVMFTGTGIWTFRRRAFS